MDGQQPSTDFPIGRVRPAAARSSLLQIRPKAGGSGAGGTRDEYPIPIAIGAAVFTARGHPGNRTAVAAGFRPALWSAAVFAALAAASALAILPPAHQATTPETTAHTDPDDVVVAA